jgi:hypothetical protein
LDGKDLGMCDGPDPVARLHLLQCVA